MSVTRHAVLVYLAGQFPWLTPVSHTWPGQCTQYAQPDCSSKGPQVVTTKQEVMTDLKHSNGDEGEKKQNTSSGICLLF